MLFALPADKRPSIDKDTFIILAKIASCDVLMSTHDGYYRQTDGLAMGSPPAPHLANGWLSKYDPVIMGNQSCITDIWTIYSRRKRAPMLERN